MKNNITKAKNDIDRIQYLLNRFYLYTDNRELINIEGIRTVLGVSRKKAVSIIKNCKYIDGRSHLYFVIDVVNAFDEYTTSIQEKENQKLGYKYSGPIPRLRIA